MPETSIEEWNAFLLKYPDAHLLQTAEWGQLKSAFGWTTVHIIVGEIGAQILFRRLPLGLTFAYIPKGPLLAQSGSDPAMLTRFWLEVEQACRKRRAVFLKVEPNAWEFDTTISSSFFSKPLIPSPQNVQPICTLLVDLRGNEEDIFNRMKPKTRYNIRLAGRKEVVVHPSDDLQSFYQVMLVTSERMDFHVHSFEYYRRAYELFHPKGMCELLIAEFDHTPLATVMVFAKGKQAYYLYGASSDEERNRKPTYPLQWEAMRWAKGRGCEEYDMWGIPDEEEEILEADSEEREDGLWGVYRFKKGFGGRIMRSVPTMDWVYNAPLYRLYLRRFSGKSQD